MIKDRTVQDYIKESNLVKPIEHIVFSFKYVSSNKNYGLSALRKENRALFPLIKRLNELSQKDILSARFEGKQQGCEPLPYNNLDNRLKQTLSNVPIIEKNSTLSVFRFGSNDYRLICKSDACHSNILYILAIDLNFNAYAH